MLHNGVKQTNVNISSQISLVGAHMPTAGGVQTAITGGSEIGCNVIQLFTSSPRQWRSSPLKQEAIDAFKKARAEAGTKYCIAHDSYLINLAAADGEILEKSLNSFREELIRAEQLGLDYLVTHMGAHGGDGEDVGLERLCESLTKIHKDLPGYKVQIALETTAGQGTYLGSKFEHFPKIFNLVGEEERLAVCLDTCHIFAAGYDIRTPETYSETMEKFGSIVGFDRLKVIHTNDSQKAFGSKADRHAHIGEGQIGIEAFRLLINDERLKKNPFILETPEAETMHAVNLKRLKDLIEPNKSS
jgi:deoxyribonuclease-4